MGVMGTGAGKGAVVVVVAREVVVVARGGVGTGRTGSPAGAEG